MPARNLHFVSFFAVFFLLPACATLPATHGGATQSQTAVEAGTNANKPQKRIEGPSPDSLMGSDPAEILKLVGAPGLVRHERGVEVWQYTDDICVLLLYFYDDTDGARKLTYLEALAKSGASEASAVSPAGCLSDQARAFRAKDLG
jgi:hypothetical protein